MFQQRTYDIPSFTGEVADEYFERIQYSDNRCDDSFIATARALLFDRMKEDENFFIEEKDASLISAISIATVPANQKNRLYILSMTKDDTEMMDDPTSGFLAKTKDWTELRDIQTFVKNTVNAIVRIYIHVNNQSAILAVADMDTSKYHLMQSFLPRYFPTMFKEKPLSEIERTLLKSLTKKTATEYHKTMKDLSSKYDLREITTKKKILKFTLYAKNDLVRDERIAIERCRADLKRIEENYKALLKTLQNHTIQLESLLQNNIDEQKIEELNEYFATHKNIEVLYTENEGSLNIIVKTKIDSYDPDMYLAAAKNNYIYEKIIDRGVKPIFSKTENCKKFMDAIFSDEPALKINTCGYFELSTTGYVTSSRDYEYGKQYENCMPNPHLQYFNCLGNYMPMMKESMREGNIISAIELCTASAQSLNFSEISQTVVPFMNSIMNSDKGKFISLNNTDVTPEEAMNWLLNKGE